MSEGASEAVGTAPTSSRHGSVFGGLFKRGEAKENAGTPNGAMRVVGSRQGSGFLSPMTRKKASAGPAPSMMGPASSSLSAGGWAAQTAPIQQQQQQQQQHADMSKTHRPEMRRALVEKRQKLLEYKAMLQSELAALNAELADIDEHLDKLSLFDDLDLDGSASSTSCAVVRDTSSRGSRRSVRSMLSRTVSKKIQQPEILTLQEIIATQHRAIPAVVQAACDFLRQPQNIVTEGLFRVSSSEESIAAVVDAFAAGHFSDFSQCDACVRDPHIVAAILKRFFRMALREPLISNEAYVCLAKILNETTGPTMDVMQVRRVLEKMVPRQERFVLQFLLQFLSAVAAHSANNKMHSANLGVVIAPNIFRLPDGDITSTSAINSITSFMIDHFDHLFGTTMASTTSAAAKTTQPQQPGAAGRRTSLTARRSSLASAASGSPGSPRRTAIMSANAAAPRTSTATAAALLDASGRSNGSASGRRPTLSPNAARVAAARAAAAAAEIASTPRMAAKRRESGTMMMTMGSPMASASTAGSDARSITSSRHHGHTHTHKHRHVANPQQPVAPPQ